jgi:hypothetical protein
MTARLKPAQIEKLKARFRAIGCTVKNINRSTFEVVHDDFPVRTHVEANRYYLQLGASILAKPRHAVKKSKVHEFLCQINLKSKLVKFTMEANKPDKDTASWPFLATVKLITGVAGGDYQPSALKNLLLLWLQDLADLMVNSPKSFEIHPMMDLDKLIG